MYISNAKLTNLEEISVSSFLFFLHCLSDSLPYLRSKEALRLLPLRQTSAVFFMILRLAPHYGFCTSILNLGSAIYDFLKTPNKDNHNSQLSNVNFSFFYSTQAFIGQAKDYQSQVYRYYIEHLIQHICHTKKHCNREYCKALPGRKSNKSSEKEQNGTMIIHRKQLNLPQK